MVQVLWEVDEEDTPEDLDHEDGALAREGDGKEAAGSGKGKAEKNGEKKENGDRQKKLFDF
jgi:hypothetical protein